MSDTFGKRARLLRDDLGLNQEDVVAAINAQSRLQGGEDIVTQSYWSKCETSDRIPGGDIVRGAAKVLRTTSDYLLLLTDNPNRPDDETQRNIHEEADRAAIIIDNSAPERRVILLDVVRAMAEVSLPVAQDISAIVSALAGSMPDRVRSLRNFITGE